MRKACKEVYEMLLIVIAALVLGSLLFRSNVLPEGTAKVTEPAKKAVKATVDGKPVHSYIADKL